MNDAERIQIDALVIKEIGEGEADRTLGQAVYVRGNAVLQHEPFSHDMQILHGTDDDRMVQVKRKRIIYRTEKGLSRLELTNFHNNGFDNGLAVTVNFHNGEKFKHSGETLMTVLPDGTIDSPLGLVQPELASAIMEMFEDVPKVEGVSF